MQTNGLNTPIKERKIEWIWIFFKRKTQLQALYNKYMLTFNLLSGPTFRKEVRHGLWRGSALSLNSNFCLYV